MSHVTQCFLNTFVIISFCSYFLCHQFKNICLEKYVLVMNGPYHVYFKNQSRSRGVGYHISYKHVCVNFYGWMHILCEKLVVKTCLRCLADLSKPGAALQTP